MAEQIAYTTEQIMEQAQVFASAWSLVGGCFDAGDQLEVAEQEKSELRAMLEQHAATAGMPADYVLMPRRLTAENGAKDLLRGEFLIEHTATCSACHFDEPQDDCEVCAGEVEYTETIQVDWTTIKAIYAKAVEGLAVTAAPAAASQDECEWCCGAGHDPYGDPCKHCTATDQDERDLLRSRVADLLHLLQYASITTPSNGDAEQAKIAMSDLARMLAAKEAADA